MSILSNYAQMKAHQREAELVQLRYLRAARLHNRKFKVGPWRWTCYANPCAEVYVVRRK